VALGRSDDPRGIGDHHRVRGVDGFRGGVTGYALVDAPAMTQRGRGFVLAPEGATHLALTQTRLSETLKPEKRLCHGWVFR